MLFNKQIVPSSFCASSLPVFARSVCTHTHAQTYGVKTTVNNLEVVQNSEVVWLAVKPHAVGRVLSEISPAIRTNHHLIVSAAAGIPVKTLEKVSIIL